MASHHFLSFSFRFPEHKHFNIVFNCDKSGSPTTFFIQKGYRPIVI